MKGHRDQASAGPQDVFGRGKAADKFAQFVIHEQPKRLE
jgi:hypothetical protein